jgi:phosphoserine phosphatase RsbU/P
MATIGEVDLRDELRDRRGRLETAIATAGQSTHLSRLLREVDDALARMDEGTYGLCDTCHDPVELERLLGDPLIRTCLDHLTPDETRALERDLDLAAEVQSGLLPQRDLVVGGWEVFYHYEPAGPVSGDYCDLVAPEGGGNDLFFFMGDVSGKGVAASMLMAGLRATVRTLIASGLPAGGLMERANRIFCESTSPSHFATLVCGKASRSGQIEICNAGHPPPILVRRGQPTLIGATGLPVGMFCSSDYRSRTIDLDPGDLLLLYTDGLSEARGPGDADYGTERLSRMAMQSRSLPPKALVGACLRDLHAFRSGTPRTDDLTLMAISRTAP